MISYKAPLHLCLAMQMTHAVYDRFLTTDEFLALKNLTEVKKIGNWMRQSFLKMNDSKTEIGIFGTQNQM